MKKETQTIDAKDQVLGRLSTKIALILQGKDKPDFEPHSDMGDFVVVKNVSQIKITGKKLKQKKYYHHSGYPGGMKEIPMEKVFNKNPSEVLRKAVYGMLPKNKLRDKRIKRLKFE